MKKVKERGLNITLKWPHHIFGGQRASGLRHPEHNAQIICIDVFFFILLWNTLDNATLLFQLPTPKTFNHFGKFPGVLLNALLGGPRLFKHEEKVGSFHGRGWVLSEARVKIFPTHQLSINVQFCFVLPCIPPSLFLSFPAQCNHQSWQIYRIKALVTFSHLHSPILWICFKLLLVRALLFIFLPTRNT